MSAGAGLVTLLPLLAIVSLAIKLNSRGPVIFRQSRRGFNGHEFMIWKFRTMTVVENGTVIYQAKRNDERVTRVGRLLRVTSIDELPQLVNVLIRSTFGTPGKSRIFCCEQATGGRIPLVAITNVR